MKHRSLAQWAQEIGSRAETWRGQVAAIRRHIALQPVRDPVAGNGRRAEKRENVPCGEWLPELLSIRVRSIVAGKESWHRWHRIARCLRNGRYREIDPRSIPGQTTFFALDQPRRINRFFVFPGSLKPSLSGNWHDFRWRGQWKTAPGSYVPACWIARCGEENLAAYLAAPGRIGHPAALQHECARYERSEKLYRRWRWTGERWEPSGVAISMPEDLQRHGYGSYEHGADSQACASEIARKRLIVAERQRELAEQEKARARRERAIRLLARIGRRINVRAEDVRAVGACQAGIEAWCRAHGIDPQSSLPLAELAGYRDAAPWALRVAARILRQHRQQQIPA